MKPARWIIFAAFVGLPWNAWPHGGAGDHAHEGPALDAPRTAAAQTNSTAGYGDTFELTVTPAQLAVGEPTSLHLYAADWTTNRPVGDATLEVTVTGENVNETLELTEANEAGIYEATFTAPSAGSYSLLVDMQRGDASELFSVTGLTAGMSHAEHAETPTARRWQDYGGSIAAAAAVVAALAGFALGRGRRNPGAPAAGDPQ